MHKLTFFPVGNADCCLMDLGGGQKFLFDFANYEKSEDSEDLRIDVGAALREDLADKKRNFFDVVAFSHGDDDHIHGFSEFFYLEHADKYQLEGRIKIKELWVPAAIIVEEGCDDETRILRAEARCRLRKGSGIRVFSRPERLREWFANEGINFEDRKHLITDAGQLVPGFSKESQGVEFFVHSPFAKHITDGLVDRNESALILHATFVSGQTETKFLIIGDTAHEILTDIVDISKYHKNEHRLAWDIYDVPHHCSYLALNDEKGKDKTQPVPAVEWLLKQGRTGGVLISKSKPVPNSGNDDQPPHRQAANCYREIAESISGEFKVTMEHPTANNPRPLIITIDESGLTIKKIILSGPAIITSNPAPRAG